LGLKGCFGVWRGTGIFSFFAKEKWESIDNLLIYGSIFDSYRIGIFPGIWERGG
jgi:hypothetical protein